MANTATTQTIDQSVRNTLSFMAWGMSALCAWVVILSAHNFKFHTKCVPYPEIYPEKISAPLSTPPVTDVAQ